ncbi:hypothetical protein HZB90_00150 [archaeon]|nr:hypothetical protein [archaeon]
MFGIYGHEYHELEEDSLDEVVVRAIRKAGKFLRQHAFDRIAVEWKGKDDPVTSLDRKAEGMIKRAIKRSDREVNFICEESGVDMRKSYAYDTVIIDPLDGTKSYLRKDFDCAVSVATRCDGSGGQLDGFVYDFMRGLLYFSAGHAVVAIPDSVDYEKAHLRMIMVGGEKESANYSPLIRSDKLRIAVDGEGLDGLVIPKSRASLVRKNGSFALTMAQVAAGIYDGMVSCNRGKGHIWDAAAGYYLMKRAGMVVKDMDLKAFNYRKPDNGLVAFRRKDWTYVMPYVKKMLGQA